MGEEQFGFRGGRSTRDPIGILRVMGVMIERNREMFVKKAFDRVEWNGIDF